MDALLAGRWNVATGIGPLVNNFSLRWNTRPPIPGCKGHVVGTPFHLRRELSGGRLDVRKQYCPVCCTAAQRTDRCKGKGPQATGAAVLVMPTACPGAT